MKRIILALAVLFFASPVFAQTYENFQLFGLSPSQLNQLDDSSQADQSFKSYQPYLLQPEPKQQSSTSQVLTIQHSTKGAAANSPKPQAKTK
jgi:hypothetical protein